MLQPRYICIIQTGFEVYFLIIIDLIRIFLKVSLGFHWNQDPGAERSTYRSNLTAGIIDPAGEHPVKYTWSSLRYSLSDRHQHTEVQNLIGTTGDS